ncbi:MAG: polysaccharide deacetylase family protein [Thermomicrobium sp.]|nr:polysaccharide deacetylase family protein [Thermomicrobium sp.]MDW7982323.1 polysaccharide deacetylase family protein [Thermomicrobium sp.]
MKRCVARRCLVGLVAVLGWPLLLLACRGPATYPTPPVTVTPSPIAMTATVAPSPTPTPHAVPSPAPTPTAEATALLSPSPTTAVPTPPPSTPTPTAPASTPTPAQSGLRATVIERLPTDQPVIALTFDCGADRGYAETILDELARRGIRATFGMTGAWARANPDLVGRMLQEGHVLINHSDTHPSFTGFSTGRPALPVDRRLAELRGAEEAVALVSGSRETMRPYFRPPYGDYDRALLEQLPTAGYTVVVLWTVDSLGWRGIAPEQVVDRVVRAAAPGAIVLLHVGAQSTDAAALPALIDALEREGYRFLTVRDVLD